ncbi:hypothetical protein Cba03nite_47150 [Catellatospora bangladeshensis]|uniref:Uncharacterized protein n=1 Tax=Catellatospora bangladeshensis TaxID=310355 RepID=A0A8J3NL35_9ACTN|nr:hypothetical protein Cba03nite_47150 [Catellatospora bangladeshensis]
MYRPSRKTRDGVTIAFARSSSEYSGAAADAGAGTSTSTVAASRAPRERVDAARKAISISGRDEGSGRGICRRVLHPAPGGLALPKWGRTHRTGNQ